MRILLVGEYSRLHNSLKEGLLALGHEVTLVGTGDGFKNFPVDHSIEARFFKSRIPNLFRQAIFRLTKKDLAHWEYGFRFKKLLPKLTDFDVVQLISETPTFAPLDTEYRMLETLARQNKKMFCLCTGTDYSFMKACVEGRFRYSLLDPYLNDKSLAHEYRYALPYLSARHKKHHEKVRNLVAGYIATDMDYHIAMQDEPKYLGLIPNPVNIEKLSTDNHQPSTDNQIVIFHGINRWNYHKKGNRFFEDALDTISSKYTDRVRIITAESLPYQQYMKAYNSCHILLDQVYAYDQGYNALEAMARGKVVFTGAEKEFEDFYKLDERVAVNALPDAQAIAGELSKLIENPQEILEMGRRAREFVEREHDFTKITHKYLATWRGADTCR